MKKTEIQKNADLYKSIIDQDRCSIVICNLDYEIIYMNPVAIGNCAKWGGDTLIGQSIMDCHNKESKDKMEQVGDSLPHRQSTILYIPYIMRNRIQTST
jgi:hypothetical protein